VASNLKNYYRKRGEKMKMMKVAKSLCAVLVLTLPCLAAQAVSPGTVDIVHSGYGAYDQAGVAVWGAGQEGTAMYGGLYMLNKTAGTGQGTTWPNGLIGGLCIELHEPAPASTFTYDVAMPKDAYNSFLEGSIGAGKANYLSELWGRFFKPAWASSGPFSPQQNSNAEAFATAVWEIIYEDLPTSPAGWDVTVDGTACTRGFRCEGANTTLANSWLHSLTGCGPKADLRAFVYDGKQDYIVQVPEPATIVLLGFGGVVSLLSRRKRAW
jgi:hypothetical protein